ncbi:hypothetical protein EON63_11190 [archaeon]|nr:MAG: hypothetical protein EON63_11190 [archaeon]
MLYLPLGGLHAMGGEFLERVLGSGGAQVGHIHHTYHTYIPTHAIHLHIHHTIHRSHHTPPLILIHIPIPIHTLLSIPIPRYVTVLHVTWLVNSAAHFFGDHPYDPSSWPAENPMVAFLALGKLYGMVYGYGCMW